MRWITLIAINCLCSGMRAQINRAWVNDTNSCQFYIVEGDTSFHVKVGKRENIWYLYYDKQLTQKASYVDYKIYAQRDSSWFRSGQLKSWTTRLQGGSCWNFREWYPDGQLKIQTDCVIDTAKTIHYYQSGAISKIDMDCRGNTHSGSFVWHYSINYYENGQKKHDAYDPNSDQPKTYFEYYESGNKKVQTTIVGHSYVGTYLVWYDNGKLKITGEYTDVHPDRLGMPQSKMTGIWYFHNEEGKLIKEEFYEEGKLVRTIEY